MCELLNLKVSLQPTDRLDRVKKGIFITFCSARSKNPCPAALDTIHVAFQLLINVSDRSTTASSRKTQISNVVSRFSPRLR